MTGIGHPAIVTSDGLDNDTVRRIGRGDRLPLMDPPATMLGGEWTEAPGQLLPATRSSRWPGSPRAGRKLASPG